jgi:predicted nuclease with TOPRIM domain
MKKGKNRYVVEVNDWGCGLMIKDTQTGREIDAPDDEVITLCIKEMNSLAKELDTVRSVAEDNQAELKATRIENARLNKRLARAVEIADSLHSNMRDCYYYVPAEQEWADFRKEDGVDL